MQRKEFEAEICERLNRLGISMFGRRIHKFDAKEGERPSYDIHPYAKQGSGVSCTITFTDAETNIPYVLLSKKKNKTQYDQVGGYTHGQGPEGSEINYDKRSEDERDAQEEAMLGNFNAVQVKEKNIETPAQTSYSLKELKDASVKGFIEQQSEKLGKKINPIKMKENLHDQGVIYNNDYNAWETAIREVKEETGLDLKELKPKELYTSDDFGISNESERLHTKVTHYLFHLGTLNKPPVVQAGSDIEKLKWIPITEVELENRKVKDDMPIRMSYLLQTLPRAVKKIRGIELARASENKFIKYKSLGAYTFSDPFSLAACKYHQEILAIAVRVSKNLKKILDKEPSINITETKRFV